MQVSNTPCGVFIALALLLLPRLVSLFEHQYFILLDLLPRYTFAISYAPMSLYLHMHGVEAELPVVKFLSTPFDNHQEYQESKVKLNSIPLHLAVCL